MKIVVLFILIVILASCSKYLDNANGKVVFISRRIENSADWQLFIMDIDGKHQKAVSNILVRCSPPILSHDGLKMAYTTYENSAYSLYTIETDGSNLNFLSKGNEYCGNPAWSADDKRIAFVKNDKTAGNTYDIYSINEDGTNETRLTNQNDNFSPQYFPESNSILFASSNGSWTGIYKMNADGSNKRLLTPKNKSFSNPKISPDESKIAITSMDWTGAQIFVMNGDSSSLKQITFTVDPNYWDSGFPRDGNINPVWSPNGNSLAYVSYENGSPDIFITNNDGTGNKRLTDTPLRDEYPSWTKDGRYILFSSNRNLDVNAEIYIMRADGQNQKPLTNYTGDDIYPAYTDQ
jgi:TolB protein